MTGGSSSKLPSESASSRFDEAALVGENHRLHPVAEAELGEDAGDVGLDRALADEQVGGGYGLAFAAAGIRFVMQRDVT